MKDVTAPAEVLVIIIRLGGRVLLIYGLVWLRGREGGGGGGKGRRTYASNQTL